MKSFKQFIYEASEEETNDNKKESMKFGEGGMISSDKEPTDSTEETASNDKKTMKLGKGTVISGGPVKGLSDDDDKKVMTLGKGEVISGGPVRPVKGLPETKPTTR